MKYLYSLFKKEIIQFNGHVNMPEVPALEVRFSEEREASFYKVGSCPSQVPQMKVWSIELLKQTKRFVHGSENTVSAHNRDSI